MDILADLLEDVLFQVRPREEICFELVVQDGRQSSPARVDFFRRRVVLDSVSQQQMRTEGTILVFWVKERSWR